MPPFTMPTEEPRRQRRDRSRKPLMVRVVVYRIASGEAIREHTKDFNEEGVKQWLIDTMLWAVRNNNSVEIFSPDDDTKETK